MRQLFSLVLLGAIAKSAAAAEAPRPRGVGPDFAKHYKSLVDSGNFACISNPSIVISAEQVNDDYCDCPDGSDEPGTSACTHLNDLSPPQPVDGLSSSEDAIPALPGFYCKNKGHIPGYVPFNYVNDGICDYELCCDGSDEWAHAGGVKCEDRCKQINKEWKKKDEIRKKNSLKANKRRKELVDEAADIRLEMETKIEKLQKELTAAEAKEQDLQKKYEEVERRERGKVVKTPGKGGKVSVLASVAKARIDELREALGYALETKTALRVKVAELEQILMTFKEEYNPNFNDEGVKRAVKAWEDYAAAHADDEANLNVPAEREAYDIAAPDSETNGVNFKDFEEEESDVDALYRFEEYLPESVRDWIRAQLASLRILLIENGILADSANSGSESKLVTDARKAHKSAKDDLNIKQKQLNKEKEDLDINYGPDDIFRALKGSCVTTDSGEYTYELCWMDRTNQKSKKGGGNTNMGKFVRIDKIFVDEETSDDGRGLGTGERLALRYENGQGCWNGPARSTTVILGCAAEEEIWKVFEEEKCVYRMEVGTPAACDPPAPAAEGKKDEL